MTTDQEKIFLRLELEEAREEAEDMGITLQEYLLLRIMRDVEQLPYRGE